VLAQLARVGSTMDSVRQVFANDDANAETDVDHAAGGDSPSRTSSVAAMARSSRILAQRRMTGAYARRRSSFAA
jgi:hypothetical protein